MIYELRQNLIDGGALPPACIVAIEADSDAELAHRALLLGVIVWFEENVDSPEDRQVFRWVKPTRPAAASWAEWKVPTPDKGMESEFLDLGIPLYLLWPKDGEPSDSFSYEFADALRRRLAS